MNLFDKINKTIFTANELERFKALEENYQDDVAKHKAMNDADLAEAIEYYVKNSQQCKYARGEPVYDGVLWHVMIPEVVRRLKLPTRGPRVENRALPTYDINSTNLQEGGDSVPPL